MVRGEKVLVNRKQSRSRERMKVWWQLVWRGSKKERKGLEGLWSGSTETNNYY
jgi:hypothetical protein